MAADIRSVARFDNQAARLLVNYVSGRGSPQRSLNAVNVDSEA